MAPALATSGCVFAVRQFVACLKHAAARTCAKLPALRTQVTETFHHEAGRTAEAHLACHRAAILWRGGWQQVQLREQATLRAEHHARRQDRLHGGPTTWRSTQTCTGSTPILARECVHVREDHDLAAHST